MPAKMKLTETACKNAPPDSKLWDTEIRGFGLFSGKKRKTFYYQRDAHGKTVRSKIGVFGEVTAIVARAEATILAADHATGAVAARLRESSIPTLGQAVETYLARPKLRSEANKKSVAQQMKLHLSDWTKLRLDEITRQMCVARHAKITKNGTRAANHVMKSFRSIYNHALRTHDMPVCPTIAIEWHEEIPPRTIIEDFDEWREVVDGLLNPVHTTFYKFLLFTGLRLDETLTLRWDQIRDDHLHLPMTKNGREFNLPLLDMHHEIIEPMRAYRSEFVFHGQRHAKHLKSPARIAWSAHTHRRTFATVAEFEAGLDEITVGHLLNHTSRSVTGTRYVVSDYKRLHKPMTAVVGAFKRMDLI